MKKYISLFFVGLFFAVVMSSFSLGGTVNASEALAITNTPADISPTQLPTEFFTPTPILLPTNPPVVVPTNTPTPENPPDPSGQDVPQELPSLGMVENHSQIVERDSPITRIQIPSLDLESQVELVPVIQGVWDISSLGINVGWLENTSQPNMNGITALVGHLNEKGGVPGPFAQLDKLKWGAEIIVSMGDEIYHYRVVNQTLARERNIKVLKNNESPRLLLITCYRPSWDITSGSYLMRRIIIAEPVRSNQ